MNEVPKKASVECKSDPLRSDEQSDLKHSELEHSSAFAPLVFGAGRPVYFGHEGWWQAVSV